MTTQDPEPAAIKADLTKLIAEARSKGMWIYCSYQQLWFTPSEPAKAISEDRFVWGRQNWRLRNPSEKEAELLREQADAISRLAEFRERRSKS